MASTFVARPNSQAIDVGMAILAGIVAMAVFTVIEIALSWAMRGASPWQPLVVFGTAALPALMPSAHAGGGIRTMLAGAAPPIPPGGLAGRLLADLRRRIGA